MHVQIKIIGAGIAGLWLFHRLKHAGYDAVLMTNKNGIGHGQTLASQGIIHSGLKYAIAGKVNNLAKSISHMPNRWRDALNGHGDVDLTRAKMNASNQQLMIPKGIAGDLIALATKKALGETVTHGTTPYDGFKGTVLDMGEMVLNIPSVIHALAEPYHDHIITADPNSIQADLTIYTAAAHNKEKAQESGHARGLETQNRPLLMGLIKNAPFDLYAHFVGKSEKPIATVTTHYTNAKERIWYLGGQVAERAKDSNPQDVYDFTRKAFQIYLPDINMDKFEWGVLPIDRIEGRSHTKNWMPDTPTIHQTDGMLYCWPTKLTFAPMLTDMVFERIDFPPNNKPSDMSIYKRANFAKPPWETTQWTS